MSYLITKDNEEVSKMVITADTILTIDIFHNIFFLTILVMIKTL